MIDRHTDQNPLPSLTSDLRRLASDPPALRRPLTSDLRPPTSGFTLIELLVVIGIIILLTALLTPAFTNLKSAGDVTSAAYTIKGVLEQARTYAMANNTYTWVGFYEQNTTDASPTSIAPPYPGKGRVLLATIYSIDGTKIYDDIATSAPYPTTSYKQIGKLTRIDNVHLTDIAAPPSPTPNPTPLPNSLAARSRLPYTENASTTPPGDHYNRISSDSSDVTKFTFSAQNYSFYKTVRFNPRGEANINSTYDLRHMAEIGLRPTHGATVDANSTNLAALQFGGTTSDVAVYRK